VVYQIQLPYYKICYVRSSDGGESWTDHIVLSDNDTAYNVQMPRTMHFGQKLICIWLNGFRRGVYIWNVGYSISDDDGLTWQAPRYVLSSNRQWPFNFAASAWDSLINVVAACSPNDTLAFYSIRSTDFGAGWTEPAEIYRAQQAGMPDQTSFNGLIHFAWDGNFIWNRPWDTYYTMSTDGGLTWSENVALSTIDQHGSQMPSICVNAHGAVAVTWDDGKYSPYLLTGDILLRQSSDSGNVWTPEVQVTFNHYAFGKSDIIAVGDTIHVGWEDESLGLAHISIYYVRSTDNGNTWDDPYWLDQTTDNSWNPALAASNGRTYAVWYDEPHYSDTVGLYFSRWGPEPDAIADEGRDDPPQEISLRAYPNPFNSSTTITYSGFEKGGDVNICNATGQLVRRFRVEAGGDGRIVWDATDARGQRASSGTYFVKFFCDGHSKTLRLIYVK
jgi:hypothetical protein